MAQMAAQGYGGLSSPAPEPEGNRLSGGMTSGGYRAALYQRSPTFDDEYGMSVPLDEDEVADLLASRTVTPAASRHASRRFSTRTGGGPLPAEEAEAGATADRPSSTIELREELPQPAMLLAEAPPAPKPQKDNAPLLAAPDKPDASRAATSHYAPIWRHKRVTELWTTPDWWAVWIGCANFLCVLVVILIKNVGASAEDGARSVRRGSIVPHPLRWTDNPLDAWDAWTVGGTLTGILPVMVLPLFGALRVMGKFTWDLAGGFAIVWVMAVLCKWLGAQHDLSRYGFGAAIIALIVGLLLVNVAGRFVSLARLEPIAGQGEWFIKIALVLMAVELRLLGEYGAPGIIVGWVCSPISIAFTYWFGTRVLRMESNTLCMLIGCGISWCGASAITAVAPTIKADPADTTVAIGVVCFFVIFQTFALAYFARAVSMDSMVAGAWLGGSVDQTANVVIAGDIVDEDAKQVAGTVKMILNAGLGAMCVGVAMFWVTKVQPTGSRPTFAMLWDKFPKFVVGFLALSAILTLVVSAVNAAKCHALPRSVTAMSNWWMVVGFICVGLNTDVRKLGKKVKGGSVLALYFVGGLWDIVFTYGVAHLFFSGVWGAFPRPDGIEADT
eukprot:TRINITY_DN14713_c1_g1_i1.p1 TRINITY_DN14713_c1_g1~~TRINITY_DN14713_c1_g1_i1.p1  ORF type:complete len:644 (+),score=201.53 TRINITY_DN14713_c1_g1_i1:91-1932(+)